MMKANERKIAQPAAHFSFFLLFLLFSMLSLLVIACLEMCL